MTERRSHLKSTRHRFTLHTDRGVKIRACHLVVATVYETAPYLADGLTRLVGTSAFVTEHCTAGRATASSQKPPDPMKGREGQIGWRYEIDYTNVP